MDSQAAIRSLAKPRSKLNAYAQEIARQTQDFQTDSLANEVRWIPAHRGMRGNEMADTAAKKRGGEATVQKAEKQTCQQNYTHSRQL